MKINGKKHFIIIDSWLRIIFSEKNFMFAFLREQKFVKITREIKDIGSNVFNNTLLEYWMFTKSQLREKSHKF